MGGRAGRGRRHRPAGPPAPGHYRARYQAIIDQGWRANPPPATTRTSSGRSSRQRRSKPANLLVRLDDHREEVLRFATDFRVPFDNNQAERDIRMAKLQQKISGSWRTLAGAQRFCRLRSYVATARNQHVGVLAGLRRVFEGDPGCRPPPIRNTPTPDGAC